MKRFVSRAKMPFMECATALTAVLLLGTLSCSKADTKKADQETQEAAAKEANAQDKPAVPVVVTAPPAEPPPAKNIELPPLDIPARLRDAQESVGVGVSSASSELVSTQASCAALPILVQPFCWEGVGASYLASDNSIEKFEASMEELNTTFPFVHCGGLGFGAPQVVGSEIKKLEKLTTSLNDECRSGFWDGFGYFRAVSQLAALLEPCHGGKGKAAKCDKALKSAKKKANVTAACATSPNKERCSFGYGRALLFLSGGDITKAISLCSGDKKSECLAGVGFRFIYMFPDAMGATLDARETLTGDDLKGYLEGMGIALLWRKKSEAEELTTAWLPSLSDEDRKVSEALLSTAEDCGAMYFRSGTDCTW